MAKSRTSLSAFLASARAALAAPPSQRATPLTFVVGNESADLDSLCSAVLLAYLRTHPVSAPQSPTSSAASGSAATAQTLHVPLCNIPRADLPLHPEFAAVLRGDVFSSSPDDSLPTSSAPTISPADIPTLSDLPSPDVLHAADTRWILVDHNAPTGELAARFFPAQGGGGGDTAHLAGCVDHHADEGVVPAEPAAESRLIETTGSCASLVVELCRREGALPPDPAAAAIAIASPADDDPDASAVLNAQLARLALAPVLVDTRALGDAAKTTPRDAAAADYAEALLLSSPPPPVGPGGGTYPGRRAVFERLSALKSDISAMSLRDVLRKDYKEWTEDGDGGGSLRLGMSSVPQGMGYVAAKAGREAESGSGETTAVAAAAATAAVALAEPLRRWAEERSLDLLAVMTASEGETDGVFRRELLLFSRTTGRGGPAAAATERRFVETGRDALGLETWHGGELDHSEGGGGGGDAGAGPAWGMRCWSQARVENSRKQIAPMLREAMRRALADA